jgi:hypothetical protein
MKCCWMEGRRNRSVAPDGYCCDASKNEHSPGQDSFYLFVGVTNVVKLPNRPDHNVHTTKRADTLIPYHLMSAF